MPSRLRFQVLVLTLFLVAPAHGLAQTATYHLHKEVSDIDSQAGQLQTANPEPPTTAYQSMDFKNLPTGDYHMKYFFTPPNVPNVAGVIPSGSVVSFTLWMKKTSNWGVIYPRATSRAFVIGSTVDLCTGTAASALTTTLTAYTFTCTTTAPITMTPEMRFDVRIHVNVTTAPGNHAVKAELDIEGTALGNYDSRITLPLPPPPSITNLTPTSAPVNAPVQITGTNFGSSAAYGTVRFNGVAASTTSWTSTSITATVPASATSGPVTVALGSVVSNGVAFTVVPPPAITSLTPSSAAVGEPITIAGSNFLSTQGSSTVRFNGVQAPVTSWSNGSITATVPFNATTGPVIVSVFGTSSNSSAFTVTKGAIGGTITAATGGAPLVGATIQAIQGVVKATTSSGAGGTYSMTNLDGGPYVVRVVLTGYATEVRSDVVVTGNTTTPVNVAMTVPGSVTGTVTETGGSTPIPGASLTLVAGGTAQATVNANASGDYVISGMHAGPYTLLAESAGFAAKEVPVTIPEGGNVTADVALDAAAPTPISYAYDELGRLISVVDPAGEAATFNYDAAGNLISITRHDSSTVAIVGIAPGTGPIGTQVALSGTGFSTTPSQNTVTFAGVNATVTSASATQLIVTVPSGVSPGAAAIALTTPGGNASGPEPFVVTVSTAPTITGFTPSIGVPGTAVTINGTNFQTPLSQNTVLFNIAWAPVSGGSATTLNTTVPAAGTSGPLTVTTPAGTAVSTADFFVPPPTYTVANVEYTARTSVGGSYNVPATAGGKIALLAFNANAGQRVSILMDQVVGGSRGISVYGADGANLFGSTFFGSSGGVKDSLLMSITGTYTLMLHPGSAGQSARITLFNAPDVTGTLVINAPPTPMSFPAPGQRGYMTFSGTTGQQVTVRISANTLASWPGFTSLNHCAWIGLYRGSTLLTNTTGCQASFNLTPQTLPANGTYTVVVDPEWENFGGLSLQVTSP